MVPHPHTPHMRMLFFLSHVDTPLRCLSGYSFASAERAISVQARRPPPRPRLRLPLRLPSNKTPLFLLKRRRRRGSSELWMMPQQQRRRRRVPTLAALTRGRRAHLGCRGILHTRRAAAFASMRKPRTTASALPDPPTHHLPPLPPPSAPTITAPPGPTPHTPALRFAHMRCTVSCALS